MSRRFYVSVIFAMLCGLPLLGAPLPGANDVTIYTHYIDPGDEVIEMEVGVDRVKCDDRMEPVAFFDFDQLAAYANDPNSMQVLFGFTYPSDGRSAEFTKIMLAFIELSNRYGLRYEVALGPKNGAACAVRSTARMLVGAPKMVIASDLSITVAGRKVSKLECLQQIRQAFQPWYVLQVVVMESALNTVEGYELLCDILRECDKAGNYGSVARPLFMYNLIISRGSDAAEMASEEREVKPKESPKRIEGSRLLIDSEFCSHLPVDGNSVEDLRQEIASPWIRKILAGWAGVDVGLFQNLKMEMKPWVEPGLRRGISVNYRAESLAKGDFDKLIGSINRYLRLRAGGFSMTFAFATMRQDEMLRARAIADGEEPVMRRRENFPIGWLRRFTGNLPFGIEPKTENLYVVKDQDLGILLWGEPDTLSIFDNRRVFDVKELSEKLKAIFREADLEVSHDISKDGFKFQGDLTEMYWKVLRERLSERYGINWISPDIIFRTHGNAWVY